MELTPVTQKFILHWGEMGSRWGVNRTVAQIHALLYIADTPMDAEEISETLSIARSNVSTSLRELQNWGLVRVIHVMGDRRDHFEASHDVWEIFRLIVEERKHREIDPTLTVLRACAVEGEEDAAMSADAKRKMQEVLEFMETLTGWYDDMKKLPTPTLLKMMKMGSTIGKFLGKSE
jgi:DNA-binding transcriptional regulator GbsR (MarR family)